MTKVRDINDESEPNQTYCEKVAGWELWKKILLGVGIASALTLVITLPIVLTVNETSVIPDGNMTTASGSTGLFTTTIAADGTTTSASKTTLTTTLATTTSKTMPVTTTTSITTTIESLTTTTVVTTLLTTTAGATSMITTTGAIATTGITTPALPPTPPPPYKGWGEWLEWSGCTVSCGIGQRSRVRLCSDGNGSFGNETDCPGDGFNSEECSHGKCLSGDKMVTGGYSRKYEVLLITVRYSDREILV